MKRTPTLLALALAVAIGGSLIVHVSEAGTATYELQVQDGERVVGRHRATVALAG